MPKVPFIDLLAQHQSLLPDIDNILSEVIQNTAFVGGPYVAQFESDFAEFCLLPAAVGTSSGTTALHLIFSALGIGAGDEVITVPNTFIATAETITQTGARPVFVDVEDDTLNMDPEKLEAAITDKTRAIVPVHLYGQMANMDPIMEIAKKHDLLIVEDAAQAHGAEYKGKRAGHFGAGATFSFYPGKILGAYGDAGMVVTKDQTLADKMESLANHGRLDRYTHFAPGYNYRMAGFQGAVLRVKLKRLEDWIVSRRKKADLYASHFDGSEIKVPVEASYSRHVYTYYVIRSERREQIQQALENADIASIVHYPVPLHLQPAYQDLGYKQGDFPVAEKAAQEILSLPLYPEMSDDMVVEVAKVTLSA